MLTSTADQQCHRKQDRLSISRGESTLELTAEVLYYDGLMVVYIGDPCRTQIGGAAERYYCGLLVQDYRLTAARLECQRPQGHHPEAEPFATNPQSQDSALANRYQKTNFYEPSVDRVNG